VFTANVNTAVQVTETRNEDTQPLNCVDENCCRTEDRHCSQPKL